MDQSKDSSWDSRGSWHLAFIRPRLQWKQALAVSTMERRLKPYETQLHLLFRARFKWRLVWLFGYGVGHVSENREACAFDLAQSVALLRVTDLKLPLPFGLVWRKDNASALLAKFVADVRSLPEVEGFTKR